MAAKRKITVEISVREEIGFLERELAGAVGLGARDREAASSAERARWVVTKRIKEALKKIADAHPRLGSELALRIKTGRVCCYVPDRDHPIPWLL